MTQSLVLSLRPEARLTVLAEDRALLESPRVRIPFDDLGPGLLAALRVLAAQGATEDALSDLVLAEDGAPGLALFYYCLQRLAAQQLLCYTLRSDGATLATLTPMGPGVEPARVDVTVETRVRLSRFAYCRRDGDGLVLESPLAPARLMLYGTAGTAGTAALAALARATTPDEVAAAVPDLDGETACALVQLLKNGGIVALASEDGLLDEDASVPLRQWEFHDLLFHSRSRAGRHDYPFGGTFRFLEALLPLSAVKSPTSRETIALPKPDLKRLAADDLPLTRVLEARRSLRSYGERPITLAKLGEFLYRVASVREVVHADPERGMLYEVSRRPYPSGGATYDIELYLSVNICDGLESGLYHYDPLGHQLVRLDSDVNVSERLLADACASIRSSATPDVLITLTSRFQRLSWKYRSMAYAATLKNVGVLYQSMYLVAAAMNLSACALGAGNAEMSTEVFGLEYTEESSVGEFLLGGSAASG